MRTCSRRAIWVSLACGGATATIGSTWCRGPARAVSGRADRRTISLYAPSAIGSPFRSMAPKSRPPKTIRSWPGVWVCSAVVTSTKSPSTALPSRSRTEPDLGVVQPLTRRAFLTLGAVALGAAGGLAGIVGAAQRERPVDRQVPLGDLTLLVHADPWRLSLRGPAGEAVWDEPPDHPLAYQPTHGHTHPPPPPPPPR